MNAPALVFMMADITTGARHVVAMDIAGLHRRSQRYPALCGDVFQVGRLTTSAPGRTLRSPPGAMHAERTIRGGFRVHVTVLTKAAWEWWANTG
jgi:hypothetical protein